MLFLFVAKLILSPALAGHLWASGWAPGHLSLSWGLVPSWAIPTILNHPNSTARANYRAGCGLQCDAHLLGCQTSIAKPGRPCAMAAQAAVSALLED